MSTYREIVGKKIKKVSSDPSSGTDGEMWYNSTTGTLRGPAIVEAWSSGPPINTARGSFASATASQTAGLILLLSMIGAIVLTFRKREGVKRQNYFSQISREKNQGVELVEVKSNEGVKIDV